MSTLPLLAQALFSTGNAKRAAKMQGKYVGLLQPMPEEIVGEIRAAARKKLTEYESAAP